MGTESETRLRKETRAAAEKLLAGDYFVTLGVSQSSTPDEVKKAFLDQVRVWHPDRVQPALEELRPLYAKVFARLEAARATLSDPVRRLRYVEELERPATAAAAEAVVELKKAEAFLKKNDPVRAEERLRRALELAPGNVDAQALLIWLQAKPESTTHQLQALTAQLDGLLGRWSTCERAYFYRGLLRKRIGLTQAAYVDFTKAAQLNPANIDAAREVRLYKMRQEKAAAGSAPDEAGALGFFKKLFKR